MGTRISVQSDSNGGSRSTGPARSACGGQAPTSARGAHSRTAADPSDPSLGPFAKGHPEPLTAMQVTEHKRLESPTQTKAEKFQLNCVPRHELGSLRKEFL